MALVIGKLESSGLEIKDKLKIYNLLEQIDKRLHDDLLDVILDSKGDYDQGFNDGEEHGAERAREQALEDVKDAIYSL